MKPKIKNDHNVLQMMALSLHLSWILEAVAGVVLIPEINGDCSENEDSHKKVAWY